MLISKGKTSTEVCLKRDAPITASSERDSTNSPLNLMTFPLLFSGELLKFNLCCHTIFEIDLCIGKAAKRSKGKQQNVHLRPGKCSIVYQSNQISIFVKNQQQSQLHRITLHPTFCHVFIQHFVKSTSSCFRTVLAVSLQ
jgi:hypothetical protein